MPSIRLLVAEDSTLLRRLLVNQLSRETDIDVAGEARNGREAVEMAFKLRPDVVVMDLEMPLLNGAQATERITSQHPYIKVILLTGHEELASIGRLSGAYASLSKDTTPQELIAEVRRAYSAKAPRADQEMVPGDYQTSIELLTVRHGLTRLEGAVLSSVIGAEMTMDQMAAALSTDLQKKVTVSSVKHTLQRVMTKLRIDPRTRAALVKHVIEFDQNRREH